MNPLREAGAPKRKPGPKPDMNVTPLVDVCLVLLIIFMVVMPSLQQGAHVDPPGVRHPDPKRASEPEPVTLTLTAGGHALLQDRAMPLADALLALARIRAAAPNQRLRLRGDRNLRYGLVRDVFARCQRLGFRGIGLVVTSREEAKTAAANGPASHHGS
jgi:biopolymer transport protein ExbD